ncbi:hypothetical protein CAPN004_21760 [Capnocytophaga cynodegmi]|uniref:hypothetical protein n=1 Tax=Capnocytophaga cynodegmi TaxID=28189 RepID=UPI001AD46F25|nr:hypothetical protein [Capnocytophaga cynodegmi]GIM53146.1 hypothetical protein CAPN004_21760 [Capnocytophaga cynodegmi]
MAFRLEIFKSAEEDFRNVAEFYNPILERLGYEAQDEILELIEFIGKNPYVFQKRMMM